MLQNSKIYYVLWGVMSSFFLVNSLFALECPKRLTPKDIAKMLIHRELAGLRVESMRHSSCLRADRFPFLQVIADYDNESPNKVEALVVHKDPIGQLTVKLVDKDTWLYEASYLLKTEKKTLKEHIRFFLYKDKANQQAHGCAGIIDPPQVKAVLKSCVVHK